MVGDNNITEESNILNKFVIAANGILIIFSLLTNVELSSLTLFFISIAFFCNIFYIFSADIPYKWHFLNKVVYLLGILISLILLPSFFYFCHSFDPIWSIHLCISIVFTMILLDFLTLLLFLPIGIILGYFFSGTSDIFSSTKVILMVYQVSILGIIWYFFYQSRIRQITQSKEDIKNIISSVSHELTTPLSSSLLKIEKFKTINYSPNVANILIHQIEHNIKHVIVMLELLGKNFHHYIPSIIKTAVNVNAVIQEALEEYPLSVSEKKLIHFNFKSSEIYVHADKEILKYVIFNLLKNALFFIKKAGKGEIFISIMLKQTKVCISFKDTGYGIRAEYQKKIFEQFFSRRRYGTGMGLYFCKLVIESFNGSISYVSEFGQYTEFVIELLKREVEGNNETQINSA